MKIDKIKVFYFLWNRQKDKGDEGYELEVSFDDLPTFKHKSENLFQALEERVLDKRLQKDVEESRLPVNEDIHEEWGPYVRTVIIPVTIDNQPKPSLSELTVTVDDSWDEVITVKDKDGKIVLDLTDEIRDWEFIDIDFEQLKVIINWALTGQRPAKALNEY